MASRIMTIVAVTGLMVAPASGQVDGQKTVTSTPYATDYEVSAWSAEDRRRKLDYLEQQYLASDELLGGPVAKPGEITFMQRGTSSTEPGWALTDRLTPEAGDKSMTGPNAPEDQEN